MVDTAGELIALFTAKGAVGTVNAIGSVTSTAANVLPDPTVAAYNTATLATSGQAAFTLPAASTGKSFRLLLTQDGTGSRSAAFTTSVGGLSWVGHATPTLTATAGRGDLMSFECYDGVNWIGSASLNCL